MTDKEREEVRKFREKLRNKQWDEFDPDNEEEWDEETQRDWDEKMSMDLGIVLLSRAE